MSTISSGQTSTFELNPTIQCNDLKAFERRLMETILQQKPRERLWRIVLLIMLAFTVTSSYFWLQDSSLNYSLRKRSTNNSHNNVIETEELTFVQSLLKHYIFTTSCFMLITLFLYGIHQRVMQTNILVNRIRQVLYDFALSCDDQGKLIVKRNFSRSTNTAASVGTSSMSTFLMVQHKR